MRKGQVRYVLELVLGSGFFERNARGREVFRYRENHEFIRFCSLPKNSIVNARRRFLKFKAKDGAYDLVGIRLYRERRVSYERLTR